MEEAEKDGITAELECPICRAVLTDPRVLSCQHVFCLRCIDMSSDRAKVTSSPHGGAAANTRESRETSMQTSYSHASLSQAAGGAGSSIVTVKCPYNCGRTEIPDVRSLPKNPLISNICFALRKRQFSSEMAEEGEVMCDVCSAQSNEATFCEKCSTVLCTGCASGATHNFFCGTQIQKFPFLTGVAAAEASVKRMVSLRLGIPEAKVRVNGVKKMLLPAHLLRVVSKLKVGVSETSVSYRALTLLGSTEWGEHSHVNESLTTTIEQRGAEPLTSSQLEVLCKMQDIKARQVALLELIDSFLKSSPASTHIRKHSATIDDMTRWDGGLAADCATLIDMLLSISRHLCSPLSRKVRLLATLEGLHQCSPGQANGLSNTVQQRLKRELQRHLQHTTKAEAALDGLTAREKTLFTSVDNEVQRLLALQHTAFSTWKTAVGADTLTATEAVLCGGASLRFVEGNGVVTHLLHTASASFSCAARLRGCYTVSVEYSSKRDAFLRLELGTDVLTFDCCSTGGWDNFVVKTVGTVQLGEGRNCITLKGIRGVTPPDIVGVTVTRRLLEEAGQRGGGSAGSAAAPSQETAALHSEALVLLGYCHQTQLEILGSLEQLYVQASRKYWGGAPSPELLAKERAIEKDRNDLLGILKYIMQVCRVRVWGTKGER